MHVTEINNNTYLLWPCISLRDDDDGELCSLQRFQGPLSFASRWRSSIQSSAVSLWKCPSAVPLSRCECIWETPEPFRRYYIVLALVPPANASETTTNSPVLCLVAPHWLANGISLPADLSCLQPVYVIRIQAERLPCSMKTKKVKKRYKGLK